MKLVETTIIQVITVTLYFEELSTILTKRIFSSNKYKVNAIVNFDNYFSDLN